MIPQFDGALDLVQLAGDAPNTSTRSLSVSNLVANFSLNQNKQLAGLARHSSFDDFDIEVKDSGRNFNIQCSTGFYEAVAKPAFSSITKGFKLQFHSVHLECSETRQMIDQRCNIPGFFLKFLLHCNDIHPNPATVSVHLHHTQQKVQVQGGAVMPDSVPAAAWFVQNILKQRFLDEAKNKKIAIENINRIVSNFTYSSQPLLTPPHFCPHCKKKFTCNSKPVACYKCSMFKYSSKCAPCPPSPRYPQAGPPRPSSSHQSRQLILTVPGRISDSVQCKEEIVNPPLKYPD